jgi:UDP-N-acetylglucosamine 2-epimerase (non-hydrolysing)
MTCEILHVVGARPNFVKMAPVYKALQKLRVGQKILHSGQHYDKNMSGDFFDDLGIPHPDKNLNVKGKTHAEQTAHILIGIEKFLLIFHPKIVCVYGDINTTLAASISAKKLGIKIAHIESGLRSGDMSMPEEQNRIMTDSIADIHFVTEKSGLENLKKEGKKDSVHFIGNTMIDSLQSLISNWKDKKSSEYGVVTFHRPSNVDSKKGLQNILEILESSASSKILTLL